MTDESARIIREIRGLRPFWQERFRAFLAEVAAANGRGVTDEDIRAWLEADSGLRFFVGDLVRAVPESWKERNEHCR
jgi:hypothetical protein